MSSGNRYGSFPWGRDKNVTTELPIPAEAGDDVLLLDEHPGHQHQ
jgi:hypothetical protein